MMIQEVVKPNPKQIDKPLTFHPDDRDMSKEEYENRFRTIILPKLEANCTEILKVYRRAKHFAYRGVFGASNANDFVAGIRTDRRAGYLNLKVTEASNEAVVELGGVAHRGNSIFCSANFIQAKNWGDSMHPYIVFPKDGWDVTYFKKLGNTYMYYSLNGIATYGVSFNSIVKRCKNIFIKKEISFDKNLLGLYLGTKVFELLIAGDSWMGISYKNKAIVEKYLL